MDEAEFGAIIRKFSRLLPLSCFNSHVDFPEASQHGC